MPPSGNDSISSNHALTPEELAVLQVSATGAPAPEVAVTLRLSEADVDAHLSAAIRALGAVLIALRHGLIDLPSD